MPARDLPIVSIIVVNYNATGLLRKCLQSISIHAQNVRTETIVVDNASTDEDPHRLLAEYPWITLIANRENRGFAQGNNQGIQSCRGEYLLLLNPDAELLDGSMTSLARYLDEHPEVAVVGPRLLNADGSLQPSCYRFPKLIDVAANLFALRSVFPVVWVRNSRIGEVLGRRFRQFSRHLREEEVDWVTGACMLIRRSAVDRVGMLDETYFMYYEEIDWCRRFKQGGWKVLYWPAASVLHRIGQSSIGQRSRIYFLRQVSASYYFARHHGRGSLVCLSLLASLSAGIRLLACAGAIFVRRRGGLEDLRYYWRTVKHCAQVLTHGSEHARHLAGMDRAAE